MELGVIEHKLDELLWVSASAAGSLALAVTVGSLILVDGTTVTVVTVSAGAEGAGPKTRFRWGPGGRLGGLGLGVGPEQGRDEKRCAENGSLTR